MKSFNSLRILHQYQPLTVPLNRLEAVARRIYKVEKVDQKKATDVVFCSDYTIRKLNRTYREINKATDVLSFYFGDPDFLGEIYISLQRAKIQARRFECSYDDEIIRLFVHGLFHLLGYDHETEPERKIMEKKESKYIKIS